MGRAILKRRNGITVIAALAVLLTALLATLLASFSCTSMPAGSGDGAALSGALSLDEGIAQIAAGLAARLPSGGKERGKVFLAGLDEAGTGGTGASAGETAALGRYIAGGLRDALETLGWTFIEQQKAALLSGELAFYTAQTVTGDSARRIGYELGAETVIYGSVRPVGKPAGNTPVRRQITLFATETATGRTIEETRTVTVPAMTAMPSESRFWLYDGRDNAFGLTAAAVSPDGLFHAGDQLRWLVTAERDCYITLSFVDVKGNLIPLYPLDGRDDVFLRGGEGRALPDYGRAVAAEPYGEGHLLLAAYERPFVPAWENAAGLPLRAEPAVRALLLRSLAVRDLQTGRQTAPLAAAAIPVKIVP